MSDNMTQPTAQRVEAFLASVDDPIKRADCDTLVRLMGEATGDPPRMWGPSIVGFGRYHYRYASGREGDAPLVGFSPRKANLTLYILGGFDRYDALLATIGKHKTGKACFYVKRLSDLDPDVLRELIDRSVAQMRAEHPDPA